MATMTAVQRAHQPKYVLAELSRLERNVEALEAKLRAIGEDEGPIVIGSYGRTPIKFAETEHVAFELQAIPKFGSRENVLDTRIDTNHRGRKYLNIMAAADIVVESSSTNVIRVFSEDRW